jgi:hypothetical protein
MRSWAWLGLVVCSSLAAYTAGCATQPSPRDRLLKRAAFDLKCTKDELSVTKLDDRTRGVSGCGRQATYVSSCNTHGMMQYNCTWVMNSVARNDDDE